MVVIKVVIARGKVVQDTWSFRLFSTLHSGDVVNLRSSLVSFYTVIVGNFVTEVGAFDWLEPYNRFNPSYDVAVFSGVYATVSHVLLSEVFLDFKRHQLIILLLIH